MLKLKLQYFGHLMWRANSLKKPLMLGKIEGRRRGWQKMSWFDSITDSMDMSLSKLREIVKDREAWHAEVHGVTKSRTWPSDWTTITMVDESNSEYVSFIRNFQMVFPSGHAILYPHQHLVLLVFWVWASLTSVFWNIVVVSICIFLMTWTIFFFMYLFAIWNSVCSGVGPFLNWVVFLIVELQDFFLKYTLDNTSLSDKYFANTFSQSVACLLVLLILFFCVLYLSL